MIAALGNQIIDPLEEFMTICLAYERTNPGTLRHFIKWFITGNSEVLFFIDENIRTKSVKHGIHHIIGEDHRDLCGGGGVYCPGSAGSDRGG